MDQSQLKWIADFIWNIADDRLRDVYVHGKYRDVILPFTVLRRLDAVLESTKDSGVGAQEVPGPAPRPRPGRRVAQAAGQAFYNTSEFTLSRSVRERAGPAPARQF